MSPEIRRKPISVSDREAQAAERAELLRVATALLAAEYTRTGVADPEDVVNRAAMLIGCVNARFEEVR